jgi:hypothetical protein
MTVEGAKARPDPDPAVDYRVFWGGGSRVDETGGRAGFFGCLGFFASRLLR